MARAPERDSSRRQTPTPRPGAAPTPAKKAPAKKAAPRSGGFSTPTGGSRPANDHALVSGGPFWGNPDDPNYAQQNIVTVHTDGLTFQVNENVATQFAGLIHDLVLAGYHPRSVGGYNNRDITGGSGKSNHAYGAAIDIDPDDNPRYVGKDGSHKLDSTLARQLAAKWGLAWGGDYKNSKDYMHFEALGAPRTPGSPPGGTAPVITAAAKAAGATGPVTTSGKTAVPSAVLPGQTGDVSKGQTLPPDATDQEVKDFIGKNYGYLAGFLHDPELAPILLQAARGGWDKDVLAGKLSQTNYWKKTSATARMWDAQTRTDNATQHQLVVNQQEDLVLRAQKLGYTLDPLQAHDMAVTSLRLGWSQSQIDAALQHQGKMDPKKLATDLSGLKAASAEWMVPVSDQTLTKWAKDINDGNVTQDDFTTYLKEQAKSLFPTLASAIDRGVTVKQYTDPYREYAAQLLETDPTQIDLLHDPKFSKALFNTDPKTGARTQMSLADWQTYLRSTPDYNKTSQAVDQAAQFATTLTKVFGKVAA